MTIREISRGDGGDALAFSPNSEDIVFGDHDGLVKLHRIRDGKLIWQEPSDEGIAMLAFSDCATLLARGGDAGNLALWDFRTKRPLWTQKACEGRCWSGIFLPDGLLATSSSYEGQIPFWRLQDGEQVNKLYAGDSGITHMQYSVSKDFLAAVDEAGYLYVWEMPSCRLKYKIKIAEESPGLSISGDGVLIATTGSEDRRIAMWESDTGTFITEIRISAHGPLRPHFFSHGRALIANDHRVINLIDDRWDLHDSIFRRREIISDLRLSPDDRWLGWVTFRGSLLLWDLATDGIVDALGNSAS